MAIPYRSIITIMCALAVGIGYCDRINLSVAIVKIGEEKEWDMKTKADVLGSFFRGYIFTQLIGALLSKRYGGFKVLGYAVLSWGILTISIPYIVESYSPSLLSFNRLLLGVTEGVLFPAIYHIFADYVPVSERSQSLATLSTGVFAGAITAFIVSPLIMTHFHWSDIFYLFGFLSFIWLALWIYFTSTSHPINGHATSTSSYSSSSNNPINENSHPKLSDFNDEENGSLNLSASSKDHSLYEDLAVVYRIFKNKTAMSIMFCHWCHNVGHFALLAWLPTFFKELGFEGDNLALTCIPYILMSVSIWIVSSEADKVIRNGAKTVPEVRRAVTMIGFGFAGLFIFLMCFAKGYPILSIALLSLGLSFNGAAPAAGYEAAKLDITNPETSAIFQSVSNTIATTSGIFGIPLIEMIHSSSGGDWSAVFIFIALVFESAAIVFYKFGRFSSSDSQVV